VFVSAAKTVFPIFARAGACGWCWTGG
jgi:hypothetical protein